MPPGDAALTRRVKAAGPTWTVQEKKGRKIFSQGVWAPADLVKAIQRALAAERDTPAYAKRQQMAAARRDREQSAYITEFEGAIAQFLDFDSRYAELSDRLAKAIAAHATPVGSGTVARTKRIPIEQRAASAVIAWLRHQTTSYDRMRIARKKGERRAVRRELAAISHRLLDRYRRGETIRPEDCPLEQALHSQKN